MSSTKAGDVSRDVLWVGFSAMMLSSLVFIWLTYANRDRKKDVFYHITTTVVMIAALAYLVMALGNSAISTSSGRDFLWVRYADWAFTTPLLLIDLGLLAGVSLSEIYFIVLCDILMVVAGFAGAVSAGANAAWPLFIFGCFAFLPILHFLIAKLPARAPKGAKSAFRTLSWLTIVLWSAYPVVWGIGEGGNLVSPDVETVLYAILDVIAKCGFGFILLFSHAALEAAPGVVPASHEGEALLQTGE
jgi:bacteriorhodopsin